MKKLSMLVVGLLVLSGCATMLWYKPTGTQDEFSRDKYDCLQQAQQPYSGAYVNMYGGASRGQMITNNQLFAACMNSRGWYLTRADQAHQAFQTYSSPSPQTYSSPTAPTSVSSIPQPVAPINPVYSYEIFMNDPLGGGSANYLLKSQYECTSHDAEEAIRQQFYPSRKDKVKLLSMKTASNIYINKQESWESVSQAPVYTHCKVDKQEFLVERLN